MLWNCPNRRLFGLALTACVLQWGCGGHDSVTSLPPPEETPTASETDSESPEKDASASETAATESRQESIQIPAAESDESQPAMRIEASSFGTTPNGEEITLYSCTNVNGLLVSLINYGAIVVRVETPDRDGTLANINLGFPTLEGYLGSHPHFGSTIGRFCNRIAKGKFTLDGQEYTLATNNGENHLHGGDIGFNKHIWKAEEIKTDSEVGIKFTRRSIADEEGYPGNLDVAVAYTLTNDDALRIEFTATSDKATPVNLTNHNYWNLAGVGAGKVLDHEVTIASDHYLAVDEGLIPTGELSPVAGTPLDFITAHKLGERIKEINANPQGYDHCYALRGQDGRLALAARVKDPASGRVMEVHTTQPGIQLYTGNFLDGSPSGGGFNQHEAFCLETQHYPDSPNQPEFPSSILKPGETFHQETVHRFSAE
ncbi:MAG: aldose epimerase family protein [Pirellulaceae bacterium]|jgi:aldose 1-epimerase|nr:aldose epimerase family protein [Pirellulaceae bacterium]